MCLLIYNKKNGDNFALYVKISHKWVIYKKKKQFFLKIFNLLYFIIKK